MKMKLILIYLLFISIRLFSQEIKIGQWKEHYPNKQAVGICEGGDNIYCSSLSGVFSYNTRDNSLDKLSKTNGFSEAGKNKIAYNKKENTLIIGYENATINLFRNNQKKTISDIQRANINGYKSINNLYNSNGLCYVSCSFGIVVIDIYKAEIKETYYIGQDGANVFVNGLTFDSKYIYAATKNGIYRANKNSLNLIDFKEWELLKNTPSPTGNYTSITYVKDSIYAVLENENNLIGNKTAILLKENTWTIDTSKSGCKTIYYDQTKETLILNYGDRFESIDKAGKKINMNGLYEGWQTPNMSEVITDEKGFYWIADRVSGLIKMYPNRGIERIVPPGPQNNDAYHFDIKNDQLWIASGGVDNTYSNIYNHNGLQYRIGNNWGILNGTNSEALDTTWDILHININPDDENQVFASTHGYGLLEIKNGKIITVYNEKNSSLESKPGGLSSAVKVSCSAYDKYRNLWVANPEANSLISVKTTDGKWTSFNLPGIKNIVTGKMIITTYNQKWLILPRGQGILVFSDNETIENQNDDQYRKLGFSPGNGNLPGSEITSMAEDKNGNIWVGSDEGVAVFYNPSSIFDETISDAQQIKISQDGNIQLLLETESINCIKVDGANRKWISTQKGGVFLVSEDGTEQIFVFNKNNSPIPRVNVGHIDIDDKTGEVYFGTDLGLISYKSTATAGNEYYTDIYAYPNPVKADYEGVIAIKGLVANSEIKITDISGKLVYETKSLGGQCIWNGKDFEGVKAKTGVYLVYASDENGEKTTVTKLAIIE